MTAETVHLLVPSLALVVVFLALSGLHWFWALGGRAVGAAAVPERDGKPVFTPGPVASAGVAVLLLGAALICAAEAGLFGLPRSSLSRIGVWILAIAFAGRAVGERRYVGFFKRVRGTAFARMDTWVYSPLCVAIALLCVWLLRLTRS